MATRFMYRALATAALGIALSLLLAATTATSPASSNTAGALQLDPPAAPSNCRARTFFAGWVDYDRTFIVDVTWSDNSTNEYGFVVEEWYRISSGEWVLARSLRTAANSTAASFYFLGRPTANFRFRVKAFNASGDSAWSNWAH